MTEPLALLPGLLCDHRLWAHQIHGLSDVAAQWVAEQWKLVSKKV